MGLDSVELIMEFEKAFEIRIPDQEAEKLRTVGEVHNYIWNRLDNYHSNKCNSQILFYKLRKHCTEEFGLPKNSFQTDGKINDVFPKENRRKVYRDFEKRFQLQLPSLELTKAWNYLLTIVGVISIIGSLLLVIILCWFYDYSYWLFLLPAIGIIFTLFISYLLNPKRIVITPFLIRDFVQKTLSLNFLQFAKESGANRNEVISVINQIISDKIGVDLDEITPEKSFTDDLGVD